MQTDEQLIERIRSELRGELSELQPPADLLERLRQAERPARLRLPRLLGGGWVAVTASVGVALAVATVFIVVATRDHGGRSAAAVPARARQLVSILGVLRRPQTAADRSGPAPLYGRHVEPGLTRLVRTTSGGAKVFLVVLRPVPGMGPTDVLDVGLLEPDGSSVTGGLYVTAAELLAGGSTVATGGGIIRAVAPDGVANVQVRFTDSGPITLAVTDNFALGTARTKCCDQVAQITWLDAHGRTLKTITPTNPNAVTVPPPAGLTPRQRAAFAAGAVVVGESGCLACHRIGGEGNNGPGQDLTHIGARLNPSQLRQALISPTSPMPSFRGLSKRRRAALIEFLSQLR